MNYQFHNDISIVLAGEAGQGIKTIEGMLTHVLKQAGYHTFSCKELMSRIRGGSNSTQIRISSQPEAAFIHRIDILVALDKEAIPHLALRITDKTLIIGEVSILETDKSVFNVPFSRIAAEAGSRLYANTAAAGVILGLFSLDADIFYAYLKRRFAGKDEKIISGNIEAARQGFASGRELAGEIEIVLQSDTTSSEYMLINGAEAVGFGALAGGCNFIGSYPMSPSTGVLTFLSANARRMGIVAEQAEDEIAAINMAIGAWYAGARAIVTTSGGGFALMWEGISLAGMTETPVVIHLAQRPGPATGLPTRTEQADLELALYGGHGEFPRILLAPGNLEEAFFLTKAAFDMADTFQIPVIILTDQFLMDATQLVKPFNVATTNITKNIIESAPDYRRYALDVEDGISPRAIPGFGDGLVLVDSDEHDEWGRITESMDMRRSQNAKRLKKRNLMKRQSLAPELIGPESYEILIVGWGSTRGVIKEAMKGLDEKRLAFMHVKQLYPLSDTIAEAMKKAKKTMLVENNATGQLGKLITGETALTFNHALLHDSGLPLSVEEIMSALKQFV